MPQKNVIANQNKKKNRKQTSIIPLFLQVGQQSQQKLLTISHIRTRTAQPNK